MQDEQGGNCYAFFIKGRTFTICTERIRSDLTGELAERWKAWCFFAYDEARNIFPANALPDGIKTIESITGEVGLSEKQALQAVERRLREVIATKDLDGTGFFSPAANKTWPQEFPE